VRFDYNDVPRFVLARDAVGARVPIAGKIALEECSTARETEPNWRPRAMRCLADGYPYLLNKNKETSRQSVAR